MSYDETPQTEETQEQAPVKAQFTTSTTREEREELKALSKEVFGVQSRYQKLYEMKEPVMHMVDEIVPGENGEPDTTKRVSVPRLYNGSKQFTMKYRSTQEVLELLREFKAKRDEYIATMKAQQEEAKAKKDAEDLAKKVQDDLGGSAL